MSAASPDPKLALPPDFRSQTFRLIETLLRSFPGLACVNQWRSMEGNTSDLELPTPDMAPYVGLSLIMNPNVIFGIDETRINFGMSVQTMVAGTCLEDSTRLWWQIEEAIRLDRTYQGRPLQQTLCNYLQLPPTDPVIVPPETGRRGINNLRPLLPAIIKTNYFARSNDPSCQTAEGAIVCFTNRPR